MINGGESRGIDSQCTPDWPAEYPPDGLQSVQAEEGCPPSGAEDAPVQPPSSDSASNYTKVHGRPYLPATGRPDTGFGMFAPVRGQGAPSGVTFLHINDLHGNLVGDDGRYMPGGLERLSTAISQVAEENLARNYRTVVLIAGDVFTGGEDFSDGRIVVDALRAMQENLKDKGVRFAAVLGNHEFDHGVDRTIEYIDRVGFPVLGANISIGHDDPQAQQCRTINHPSAILDVDGARVAIVGVTTDEGIPSKVKAEKGGPVVVTDPARAATAALAQVEAENPDATIVLSHVGEEGSGALAGAVGGHRVDAIIGGHSHDTAPQECAEGFDDCRDIGGVPYCRVPADPEGGMFLGRVDVNLVGSAPRVQSGTQAITEQTPPDPEMQRTLAELDARERKEHPELYAKVGHLDRDLGFTRQGQNELGGFVTRAMLDAAPGADFALINTGAMRGAMKEGDVLTGQLASVMPYDNRLVTVRLSGRELKAVLAKSDGKNGDGMYLQYAGDHSSIDDDRVYTIVTIDFLVSVDHTYFAEGTKCQPVEGESIADGKSKPLTLRTAFAASLPPVLEAAVPAPKSVAGS